MEFDSRACPLLLDRNIAECMTRLSLPPLLISAVGDDELGHAYVKWADKMGMVEPLSHIPV
jgi:sugar/nucleoside kinase (ribokinase family)